MKFSKYLLGGVFFILLNTFFARAQSMPYQYDSYTIGLWHLDEGGGNVFYDETTFHNNGTIETAIWTQEGKFGNALYYNLTGTPFSKIPITSSLQNLTECTIEMWFKLDPDALDHGYKFILMRYGTDQGRVLATLLVTHVHQQDSVVVDGYFYPDNSLNSMTKLRSKAIQLDTWYNVALTYDGQTERLYINNELQDESIENLNLVNPTDQIWIGKNGYAYKPHYFRGIIDEIRISNIARYKNTPPIASAGNDTTIEATSCTSTLVTLNGSNSYDPDNDSLSFKWFIDDSLIATGEKPTISLPLGATKISLVVNDGAVDSAPDTVIITVVDTTPPEIIASLDTLDFHGNKVNYEILFSAVDLCDSFPKISGVIELPHMDNPDVIFKNKKKRKIKIDLKKNSIRIEDEEPENYWEELQAQRGISVYDGQQIEMKFKKNEDKYEYKFNKDDELDKAEGHEITLFCIAEDFSGNIDSLRITIVYDNENSEENKTENYHNSTIVSITKYKLEQNFPNPFNPQTTIRFSIPRSEIVLLDIFNLKGQKICTLLNEKINRGHYSILWDGKDALGRKVPSGFYIYKLKAGSFIQTRKMLILK